MKDKEVYELLIEQVMQYWDEEGVNWLEKDVISSDVGYTDYEFDVKPKYIAILKDKEQCAQELGFNSFKEYKNSLKGEL